MIVIVVISAIPMVIAFNDHVCDNVTMNWKNIIKDLLDCGLTQAEIAQMCGTGQSHISYLLNGVRQSPNWQLGDALIRLHKKVTRRKAA